MTKRPSWNWQRLRRYQGHTKTGATTFYSVKGHNTMSTDNLSIILALTSIGISSYVLRILWREWRSRVYFRDVVLRIWRDGGAQ